MLTQSFGNTSHVITSIQVPLGMWAYWAKLTLFILESLLVLAQLLTCNRQKLKLTRYDQKMARNLSIKFQENCLDHKANPGKKSWDQIASEHALDVLLVPDRIHPNRCVKFWPVRGAAFTSSQAWRKDNVLDKRCWSQAQNQVHFKSS